MAQVQKASGQILSFLEPLRLNEALAFDVRLCLEEALVNAIKYGNRQQKELLVDVDVEYDEAALRIRVEDQGSGFEPNKLPDCTQDGNQFENHGRGVYLMRQLMDEVKYNDKGNSLTMVKALGNKASSLSQGGK